MRRWHQDKKIAVREQREHARQHVLANQYNSHNRVGRSAYEIDCPCDRQVGRFRKKDAYDCGRPRCGACHGDKYYSKPSTDRRHRKAALEFREQLEEAGR